MERRLSSPGGTVFHKRIIPALWFGAAMMIAAVPFLTSNALPRTPFLLIPLVMAIAGLFMIKNDVMGLADDVLNEADAVRVRRGTREARIAVSDIARIKYLPLVRGAKVTLLLREPGIFGDRIRFCPAHDRSVREWIYTVNDRRGS
jgi:hypothetical protein